MKCIKHVAILIAWISAAWLPAVFADDEQVIIHPAGGADPEPGPVGEKPYEMEGRSEQGEPLVAFDDLTGWEVEGENAEGWLYLSQEWRLFRDYCAKLVYAARGDKKPALIIRPSRPIPIPEPWDCVNFWNVGNHWGHKTHPNPALPHVKILLLDAEGKSFKIDLEQIDYIYWFMMHGRLTKKQEAQAKRPFTFHGIQFTNTTNPEKRAIFLGPLYTYKERLDPLEFAPWPEKLPFPTRPETILPTNKTRDFRNDTRQDGEATLFTYRDAQNEMTYHYRPTDATLGDIELFWQGKTLHPCARGGICFADNGKKVEVDDPAVGHQLLRQTLNDGQLEVLWRLTYKDLQTDLTYRLQILQKSLVVDIEVSKPVAMLVDSGRAEPVPDAKLFNFPFLTYGWLNKDPRVLYTHGLFLTNLFDWYHSDASEVHGKAEEGPDWATYSADLKYNKKTDGIRNPIRERFFITASPDVHEVLPTIPNPPSPWRHVQAERLWRWRGGFDHQMEIDDATRLRNHGCDKITVRFHENTWRDTGESFTFRLNAGPKRGGDPALARMVTAIKALGWRVGLYTNYLDYAPVNSYFNENYVLRWTDGLWWPRGWSRCYNAKPMWAMEMQALLAPRIQKKFDTNHSYCDVITSVAPWHRVDYDVRVPGAGMFRRTYECYGRIFCNEKIVYPGPVYSEGPLHWIYAGLTDGNYGQIAHEEPHKLPLLVDFDLLKIHPLQMDAGMGTQGMYFRNCPFDKPEHQDQFLAATIAYGHIGYCGHFDLPGDLKTYYMMQQAQQRYAMIPVTTIEYEHEGRFLDTSTALVSGAYLNNRLHVVYENGTQVYVNGHDEPWNVRINDRDFELDRWGYLVQRSADDLLVYSAVMAVAGPEARSGPRQRVDYSAGTEQYYADSRGGFVFLGPLAIEGCAALKKDGEDWWIIPTTKFTDFAFLPELANLNQGQDVEMLAQKEDGSAAPAPELRWSRGLLHVLPQAEPAFKYRIRQVNRPRPLTLSCADHLVKPGGTIRISIPSGVKIDPTHIAWLYDNRRMDGQAALSNGALLCSVPAEVQSGAHIWLSIGQVLDGLWLDFLVE